eukprot:1160312-Pelagomonas_calceolata.AAC.2
MCPSLSLASSLTFTGGPAVDHLAPATDQGWCGCKDFPEAAERTGGFHEGKGGGDGLYMHGKGLLNAHLGLKREGRGGAAETWMARGAAKCSGGLQGEGKEKQLSPQVGFKRGKGGGGS